MSPTNLPILFCPPINLNVLEPAEPTLTVTSRSPTSVAVTVTTDNDYPDDLHVVTYSLYNDDDVFIREYTTNGQNAYGKVRLCTGSMSKTSSFCTKLAEMMRLNILSTHKDNNPLVQVFFRTRPFSRCFYIFHTIQTLGILEEQLNRFEVHSLCGIWEIESICSFS